MEIGTVLAKRYRLVRFIARGAMGEVYEATDERSGLHLAVKVLREELANDEEWCARFEQEWELASEIECEHVCRPVHAGQTRTGRRWIAFELLVGESLDQRLARERTIAFDAAAAIVDQTLRGLDAAHRLGIIHRDIKPANIFLEMGGACVRVLDFGIAKRVRPEPATSSGLTSLGTMLGTPSYMSPEQLENPRGVDARTDLYSLGLVAFRMLAGRSPFEHPDIGALLHMKRTGTIPSLSQVTQIRWPAEIEFWMQHMAARRREERFDSASAARNAWRAVNDAMSHHTFERLPASPGERVETELD